MNKTGLLSSRGVIVWLAAAGVVLAVQVASWAAAPCAVPNTFQLNACATPTPAGVGMCAGLPFSICGNSHVYNVKSLPTTSTPAASGATKQIQDDCYQDTPCTWIATRLRCVSGTTLPTPTTWYQGAKTVNNPDVTCPPS
jgi:hypothetical protein